MGGLIVYFNRASNVSNIYFWFGIVQIIATFFYMYANAVVLTYDVINGTYLRTRYPTDSYVTIQFGTPWDIFGAKRQSLL